MSPTKATHLALAVMRGVLSLFVAASFLFFLVQASGFAHDWTEHAGSGHLASLEEVAFAAAFLAVTLGVRIAAARWASGSE